MSHLDFLSVVLRLEHLCEHRFGYASFILLVTLFASFGLKLLSFSTPEPAVASNYYEQQEKGNQRHTEDESRMRGIVFLLKLWQATLLVLS